MVLLGPRQVGTTTLAREIAAARGAPAVYLDLERPADRRRMADPDAYLRAQAGKLTIVDEIHRAPDLFGSLRGIIDDRRRAGDRAGHFLSPRIGVARSHEAGLRDAGGTCRLRRARFPDSLLAKTDPHSLDWRRAFVQSYLERDVPMFAPRLPAETVGRLWTMLAHGQGTPLNQARRR